MKKIICCLTVLLMICSISDAQSIVERLEQRAKNSVENNLGNHVDRAVNSIFDGKSRSKKEKKTKEQKINEPKTEQAEKTAQAVQSQGWTCTECGHEGNTGNFCSDCGAKKPSDGTWTCPECGATGNTGKFCAECGAKKPVAGSSSDESAKPAQPAKPQKAQTSFVKSDFVPGDEIFFEDDLENEQVGEFPSKWDFLDGQECEIALLNGKKCIKLGANVSIAPLMKEADYLPEEFTLEYDVYVIRSEEGGANNYLGPFFNGADDMWVMDTHFAPKDQNWGWYGSYNSINGDDYRQFQADEETILSLMNIEDWNHVSISFNKRAMKMYLNGTRFVNIPNMARPTRFRFDTFTQMDEDNPYYYMTNIRLAKGAVPLYDRLMSDGKIITYAITFETGKADLKPESMTEIARVAKLMQENPNLCFEVQGHCDTTGSDKVNDPLSQRRAEAIVAALVDMDIAEARLSAVGKGSHEPIADNSTEEGRAKNRRVEFVKQ